MNGIVAAHYGAQLIINAIAEKGYAHVILATGASQFGALPFDPGFVRGGDDGVHRIVSDPEGAASVAFADVVAAIQAQIGQSGGTGLEIV